ncbi:MAG: signal peptidase II [Anaerolineae bacterium]|nr:signal peptidase II [Anaerolineae bacterium]
MITGCIILDQATKLLAQASLPARTLHLLGDTVRLRLSHNTGAFLGLGAGLPPAWRFWIFTFLSLVMVAGVVTFALTSEELPHDAIIALAFLAGGGTSNLIDRLLRGGHVIDFLNFGIGNLRTGILNFADIAITFGALYVIWAAFRAER